MERYTPQDILQILIDFYNCQAAFDPEVEPGHHLSFQTTIFEWRDICDLIEPKKLAKCYHDSFKLNTLVSELEILLSYSKNTLSDFCNYIADNAVRQEVLPVNIMGTNCMSAGIFKSLINNLKQKGIDTSGIQPSSGIVPIFNKHAGTLLDEVSKLAPGSFTKFEYEENRITKWGLGLTLTGIFFLFIALASHFYWFLLLPLPAGIILLIIGRRFKPKKEVIGGYDTIRDLILGMQAKLK